MAERNERAREPVSQPYIVQTVELGSRQAQLVLRRSFETAQRALYTTGIMLRVVTDDEEAIQQVESTVDEWIAQVDTELDEQIERLKKICESNGITGEPSYTNPHTHQVEIRHPKVWAFLALIKKLDTFMNYQDLLWLSGIFNDAQYNAGAYQIQRRLIRLAGRLRNLAQRSMAAARRQQAPATPEQAQENRDESALEDTVAAEPAEIENAASVTDSANDVDASPAEPTSADAEVEPKRAAGGSA